MPDSARAQQGFEGTIHFRDGSTVDFAYLGRLDDHGDCTIYGQMGQQNTSYKFSQLDEIILGESKDYYNDKYERGNVIVVNGENKLTLQNGYFKESFCRDEMSYVSSDPVTGELRRATARVSRIASITIGEHRGQMKKNPNTDQFFPPGFVYDPYTGEELIWADDDR
jgi:hypothetical protein